MIKKDLIYKKIINKLRKPKNLLKESKFKKKIKITVCHTKIQY